VVELRFNNAKSRESRKKGAGRAQEGYRKVIGFMIYDWILGLIFCWSMAFHSFFETLRETNNFA